MVQADELDSGKDAVDVSPRQVPALTDEESKKAAELIQVSDPILQLAQKLSRSSERSADTEPVDSSKASVSTRPRDGPRR